MTQEKIGVLMVKQQDLYQKMMVNNRKKSQPIPNDLSRTGWHKPILTISKYPNVSAQRLLLILTWWQPIIIHIPSHGSADPKKNGGRSGRGSNLGAITHIDSIKTCNLGRMVIFNPSKSHGVIFKSCHLWRRPHFLANAIATSLPRKSCG